MCTMGVRYRTSEGVKNAIGIAKGEGLWAGAGRMLAKEAGHGRRHRAPVMERAGLQCHVDYSFW